MTVDIASEIWGFVGQTVFAGGGGAVVAYGIFRFLGTSWIEHELATRLESAKAEISILAARRLKLHDREYVVFPELWAKLNKVFVSLNRAIVSFREMPDFTRMSKPEIDSWLENSALSSGERSYFVKEQDKSRAYGRILDFQDLNEAHKDYTEFRIYFENNRIFLNPEIKKKLVEINDLLWGSWVAKKMDLQGLSQRGDKHYLSEAWKTIDKQVRPLMVEIEALVQARLFPESRVGEQAGTSK